MVLQTSGGSGGLISNEATKTIDSATAGYDFAYRKPKITKWSVEDTNRFYEALETYGTDLFLIGTFFPNLSHSEISRKFKIEEKKNLEKFNRILFKNKRIKIISRNDQNDDIPPPIAHPEPKMEIPESGSVDRIEKLDEIDPLELLFPNM